MSSSDNDKPLYPLYRGPLHDHDDAYRELEVLRRFEVLGVRLQRAVQDVRDEAFAVRDEHDQPTMAVPMDVWEEMILALKAIHDTAHTIAFGKPQAQSQPPECSICRSRHGKEIQHACE